jgi:predicted DNA repair protein MutK
MPSGLMALLDDVATIAKLAASSIDDVAGATGKASAKAAGVVIDDAAVTPRYVTGLSPARELPVIAKIAKGSLRNKLLFILPGALALSAFAPWALTPLLMIGGGYLCFEAAEKLAEKIVPHVEHHAEEQSFESPEELEQASVAGAVRTDFILSAEIMAIALGTLANEPLIDQALALLAVAIVITAGVYGVVGLIVKLDDIGLHLAKSSNAAKEALGRGLVHAMPWILAVLGPVGTAAMLWVGGGIIVHGLEHYELNAIPHIIHGAAHAAGSALSFARGAVEWVVTATLSGVVGLAVGVIITAAVIGIARLRSQKPHEP